jgi:acetyl esterase/lipase
MIRLIRYHAQKGPTTKITVKGDEKLIRVLENIEGENLKRFVAELGVEIRFTPLKGEKHGYYELIAD